MKKMVNGELVDMTEDEIKEIQETTNRTNDLVSRINEPVDRTRITEDVKIELKQMVNDYPSTKVLLRILLGDIETKRILEE